MREEIRTDLQGIHGIRSSIRQLVRSRRQENVVNLQERIEGIAKHQVDLRPEARLQDNLGLSSLDRVELMSAIEDRYQVDLGDREFSQVSTVADLEELVKKSSARAEPLNYPYSPWAQRWPVTWIRLLVYYLFIWPATMIMAKPRIIGRERLKGFSGPALIVCNHITQTDIGFILAALPARFRHRLAAAPPGVSQYLQSVPEGSLKQRQRFEVCLQAGIR